MTATNHALTGAIIGLVVGQPAVALPAALVSHYICDVIPHYASSQPRNKLLKSKGFRDYLIVDAGLCILLVALLAFFHPEHWLLASFCAFAAAAPDFLSINKYLKLRNGLTWRPNLYSRFADSIQWFARPIGAVVEIAWFAAAVAILLPFLR